ncbi:DEAD-box ATP-dependent RNA helicase [Mortierella claussenii]|nr:DEAD-box ATP-dependent RNA helicase [Mortierella claussenii]
MENQVTERWGERQQEAFHPSNDDSMTWECQKPVYEWQEGFAEGSAPADQTLEAELYGEESRIHAGIHFENFNRINVSRKGGPESYRPINNFAEAGFHPTIIENIQRMDYVDPTPIQKNAIPLLMSGYDLLACAQTGSGKTAAFLLPVLSKILTKLTRSASSVAHQPGARRSKAAPQALIILPTRELGIQIFHETRRFTYKSRIRPVVIYGGAEMRVQKEQLARGCDVLIATPGRLVDAMERGAVALDQVRYLVLDEADRILDLGFEPTIRQILLSSDLPRDEGLHSMMFSATFPKQIQVLARDFMKENYCRLRIGRIGGTTTDILQKVIRVEEYDKEETLIELLLSQPPSRTLIFVDTKRKADYLDDVLYNRSFPCISLHGDRSQREREQALEAFRVGRSPILIATAIAARGLDIKDVLHVINYDLCEDIDDYVHRIGRTARAGNPGLATTFYNDRNYTVAPQLTKLLLECQQEVPEFLQEFVSENVSYEDDFVDLETFENMTLGEGPKNLVPDNGYSQSYGQTPSNVHHATPPERPFNSGSISNQHPPESSRSQPFEQRSIEGSTSLARAAHHEASADPWSTDPAAQRRAMHTENWDAAAQAAALGWN